MAEIALPSSVPAVAGIAIVAFCLYQFVIYPVFFSPLAKIPNAHPTSALSPLWMLWIRHNHIDNHTIQAAHVKHGPVVRLAPNEISVNCVKGGLQTVYAGGFDKHDFYPNQFANYGVPNMFSTAHGKIHSARKRMLSNVYSKSYLQTSPALSTITREVIYNRLFPRLSTLAALGKPFNSFAFFSAPAMDFVTSWQFGLSIGSNFTLDGEECEWFLGCFENRWTFNFWSQELPGLTSLLTMLGRRPVPAWVDDSNRQIEAWCLKKCDRAAALLLQDQGEKASQNDQATTAAANHPTVFAQLLSSMSKGALTASFYTDQRLTLASELLDHLAAGFETSSITLTYLVHELSQRPELQSALRSELLTLNPPIQPNSAPRLPPPKDVDALQLLHALLYETLRLHAAIPGSEPRVTPAGGCTLGPNGEYPGIPGGVRVSAQAWSIHRNEDVFPEAETWMPERWLNEKGEFSAAGEMGRWFWAFGSGGRMCIGSNLAMYQMKRIAAALYTNFTTHIVDDAGIEQIDAYTAGPKGPLMVRLEAVQ